MPLWLPSFLSTLPPHPRPTRPIMPADSIIPPSSRCLWFVQGGGHKGNRCKSCGRKEPHHHSPASGSPAHNLEANPTVTQQHAPSCPPASSSDATVVRAILDQYSTHTRPQLIRQEVVTGLRKMLPRAAKRGTQGRPGTGNGSTDIHAGGSRARGLGQGLGRTVPVARTIKVGRLMVTPHGLTKVRVLTFITILHVAKVLTM